MGYVDEEHIMELQKCAEMLAEEGLRAIKAGDYKAAEVTIGGSLELSIAVYGEHSPESLNGYHLYGVVLLNIFREEARNLANLSKEGNNEGVNEPILDKAWKLLSTAREIGEMHGLKDEIKKLEILEAMAETSLEREDAINSISCYKIVVEIVKRIFGPRSLRLADIYFRLCFLQVQLANLNAVITCWKKGISICMARLEHLTTDKELMDITSLVNRTELNNFISLSKEEEIEMLQRLLNDLHEFSDLAVAIQLYKPFNINMFLPHLRRVMGEIGNSKCTGRLMELGVTVRDAKRLMPSRLDDAVPKKAILGNVPKEYTKHILCSADVMMEEGLKALVVADYHQALACLYGCIDLRLAIYGEYAPECLDARGAFAVVAQKIVNSNKNDRCIDLIKKYCSSAIKLLLTLPATERVETLVALGEVYWRRGLLLKIQLFLVLSHWNYGVALVSLERLEPNSLRLAEVYFKRGFLCVNAGNYEAGEVGQFFKKGISVCKARLQQIHADNMTVRSNNSQSPDGSQSAPTDSEERLLRNIIALPWGSIDAERCLEEWNSSKMLKLFQLFSSYPVSSKVKRLKCHW